MKSDWDNTHAKFGRGGHQFATIGDIDNGLVWDVDDPAQRNAFEKQAGAFGEDFGILW